MPRNPLGLLPIFQTWRRPVFPRVLFAAAAAGVFGCRHGLSGRFRESRRSPHPPFLVAGLGSRGASARAAGRLINRSHTPSFPLKPTRPSFPSKERGAPRWSVPCRGNGRGAPLTRRVPLSRLGLPSSSLSPLALPSSPPLSLPPPRSSLLAPVKTAG